MSLEQTYGKKIIYIFCHALVIELFVARAASGVEIDLLRQVHTYSVCSAYTVCVCGAEAARTHFNFAQDAFAVHSWSVAVYHKHNIYPLFWFQI